MANEWIERDPNSADRPEGLASETVVDVKWEDGRFYEGAAARSVFWNKVKWWRVSEKTVDVGAREAEMRLFGRHLTWEERIEAMHKLDSEVFGGVLMGDLTDHSVEGLRARAQKILDEVSSSDTKAEEIYRKLRSALGNLKSDTLDKSPRSEDSLADRILRASENAFSSTSMTEEEKEEMERKKIEDEKMIALVHQTPELLRWARLIAGNVWICQIQHAGRNEMKAATKALAYMTGDMDDSPEVRGAIAALAVLLRDDTDFAVFRRTKLDGRSEKINSALDGMEKFARTVVRVTKKHETR